MPLDLQPLLYHVRRLASAPQVESDAALLLRFAHSRDESAFADLVSRHGPMVLRVCRRALGDAHAAEDAFQAVFLVLARRAGCLRRPEALSGWLYGVALRVARKARLARFRLPKQARGADEEPPARTPSPPDELTARELLDGLDAELQRLPEVYRLPVILCCLEGLSQEDAARRLGWTPGSVKGRLERGRARLHARLTRRGLTLAAALAAAKAARDATAAVSVALAGGAALAALAAGRTAAGVTPHVLSLADKAAAGAVAAKLKALAPLAVVLLLAGAGAGLLAGWGPGRTPPQAPPDPRAAQGARDEGTPGADENPTDAELKRLEGVWIPVAYQSGAEKAEGEEFQKYDWAQFVLTIHDGKWRTKSREGESPAADLRIDPTQSPKTMDRILAEGEGKGLVARSIYDLDGDRLRIATAFEGENVRPKAFDAGGVYVIEYRRAADGKGDDARSDHDLVRGTWDVTSSEEGGVAVPAEQLRGFQFVFTADELTMRPRGAVNPQDLTTIKYTLDPAKDPKQIDTTHEIDPGKPIIQLGVYSLEGDTLKLCLAGAGQPRPTRLDSKAGILFVLKRAGAEKLRGQAVPLQGGVGAPVLFSPDGVRLVGGDDKTLCIWGAKTGKWRQSKDVPGGARNLIYHPAGLLLRISDGIIGPRICPDASWLAGVPAGPAPTVLRDAETGEVVHTLEGVESARGDGDVMLWDMFSGKVLRALEGSAGAPTACVFSPDNRTVAGVTREGTVKLWDVATGKATRTLGGAHCSCVAFSPDGRRLAAGGRDLEHLVEADGVLWVWDASDGKELLAVRQAHQVGVTAVAFSPDGKRLITAGSGPHRRRPLEVIPVSHDGEVKVWDAETGTQLVAFATNMGNLDWALVSPDGKRVLVNLGWDHKGTALWSLNDD